MIAREGRGLMSEGAQLQKQGKLAEARDKYAEAIGYSKKAKGELSAVDRKIDAEVSAQLQLAKEQWTARFNSTNRICRRLRKPRTRSPFTRL